MCHVNQQVGFLGRMQLTWNKFDVKHWDLLRRFVSSHRGSLNDHQVLVVDEQERVGRETALRMKCVHTPHPKLLEQDLVLQIDFSEAPGSRNNKLAVSNQFNIYFIILRISMLILQISSQRIDLSYEFCIWSFWDDWYFLSLAFGKQPRAGILNGHGLGYNYGWMSFGTASLLKSEPWGFYLNPLIRKSKHGAQNKNRSSHRDRVIAAMQFGIASTCCK